MTQITLLRYPKILSYLFYQKTNVPFRHLLIFIYPPELTKSFIIKILDFKHQCVLGFKSEF